MVEIEVDPKNKEVEISQTWDLDFVFGVVTSLWKKLFSSSTAEKPTDGPSDVPGP